MKTVIILLFLILLIGFTLPSFAESVIYVKTDANSYREGETIVISGKVSAVIPGTPVTMQIFNQGFLAAIAQITVATDGSYSHTVIAEGPLWSKAGEYTIRALFGDRNIAETKFNFLPKTNVPITNTFEVEVGDSGTSDIYYTIEGGFLKSIQLNKDNIALTIAIESADEGFVSLDIPRETLDAKKQDNTNEKFITIIDGIQVPYQETITNSDFRKITINFEKGDSNIEIIGTKIIPEFGSIAVMVLVVGIIATIFITKKLGMREISSNSLF